MRGCFRERVDMKILEARGASRIMSRYRYTIKLCKSQGFIECVNALVLKEMRDEWYNRVVGTG